MEPTERVIGALQEFKHATETRLERIEGKVDSLQTFKWKAVGALMVVSFVITLAFNFALAAFK